MRSGNSVEGQKLVSGRLGYRAFGWLLLSALAVNGAWRKQWPEPLVTACLVALVLCSAYTIEIAETRARRREVKKAGSEGTKPEDLGSASPQSGAPGAQSWAEHDSILHDLSNAMTASLFIVRDLSRTLEKRPEPGLGRAKGLSQALAKELSEISEQIRCTRQNARVQPIVGEALALIEPVERCVEMVSRLHPEAVCRVHHDASAREATVAIVGGEATLKRIVENLLLNACQAQPGQGHRAEISCQIGVTETAVSLVVEDNGPGFPNVILDTFPSPSLSTKPEGTGMGLFSCHQLVARDGGTLTLLNPSSGGAKVVITWPRLPAASGTLGTVKQATMAISGTHARPGSDVQTAIAEKR